MEAIDLTGDFGVISWLLNEKASKRLQDLPTAARDMIIVDIQNYLGRRVRKISLMIEENKVQDLMWTATSEE